MFIKVPDIRFGTFFIHKNGGLINIMLLLLYFI
jgi:hypothetical protein